MKLIVKTERLLRKKFIYAVYVGFIGPKFDENLLHCRLRIKLWSLEVRARIRVVEKNYGGFRLCKKTYLSRTV